MTGGATGAGATIVQRLAGAGATVVVADVDDAAGQRPLGALGAASFVRTDVRVDGDVEHMVGFAEERHGGVDVLVNNAGGWGPTANYPFASPLQWGSTLDLNLRAPMLATQLVLEPMHRRGGGAVINVASTGGVGLAPYESPEYGAAKAGLIRFTACMAYAARRPACASTAWSPTGSRPSERWASWPR